jgi:3-dehydroshikimate dehydratase
MKPLHLLASTTSHKHEPLIPTLEVFARLGLCDLDLNLNHLIERGADLEEVRRAITENGQRVWMVSGGWCDFFDREPKSAATVASVARQIGMARAFGVNRLRLFFGRLPRSEYSPAAREIIVANIRLLADTYPDMLFVFENHDGASSVPRVCREVLDHVGRPAARLNFDPMNFEHAGVRCRTALAELQPVIAHVHLKGYGGGQFCEFGTGDVDITPTLRALITSGYQGAFTVEYEGPFDRTVRLYESVRRARATLADLTGAA